MVANKNYTFLAHIYIYTHSHTQRGTVPTYVNKIYAHTCFVAINGPLSLAVEVLPRAIALSLKLMLLIQF